MTWVLANNKKTALASYELAFGAALFDGCFYLHIPKRKTTVGTPP